MQKLKRLITALCLIFSLCLCLASFALADATGTVTADYIRVRTEPSSDSEVYQQLNKGDSVTVLADADEYGWVKIRFTYAEDGTSKVGYISQDYLSVDGAVSSEKTETDKTEDKTTEQDQQKTETASQDQKEDTSSDTAKEDASKQDADATKTETKQESDTKEQANTTASKESKDEDDSDISEKVSRTATVSGSSVRVRKSASQKAETVITVPEDDIVFVLSNADANGWVKVQYYGGDGEKYTGYMLGKYLDNNAIGTGKSNQASAIIRKTTDTSSDMVGVIPKNGKVTIYQSKDGQYHVTYKKLSGWVDASCITVGSEDDCYGYGTVTADLLRLRAKRSTDSDVITTIDKGTTLQLSGAKNGWYKTTYNGQTGYVSADYIKVSDTCTKGYVQVTASSLSLRSGAGTDFARLTTIPNGKVLKVSGSLGSWYQVTYGKFTGYISGEFVSATTKDGFSLEEPEAEVETTSATARSTTLYVTCDALTLRSQPSTDGEKLDSLSMGTQLNVLSEENGWYKISYNGQLGYVNAEYTGSQVVTASSEESSSSETSSSSSEESSQEESSSEEAASEESSSSSSSGSNSAALSYASQFVGNRYVWGGSSLTNGCDCSGFVMSVFGHFGVSLPHSSSAIRGYGKSVSYSDMQPGDVVCYSGHVGIYAGDGQLLSALNSSKGITYCSVNYKDIITIRRML